MIIDNTLFVDTIDVLTTSGTTRYGAPQTDVVASGVACRASYAQRTVVTDEGQDMVSDTQFRVRPPRGFTISAGDFILFDETYYKLLEVRKPRGDAAINHYTLLSRRSTEVS